ncbi:MAG: hypothetical protein K2M59_04660 [Muribaculaceae bacterium]|nr:hypothetical protein [Muribaculaceae bacterium]
MMPKPSKKLLLTELSVNDNILNAVISEIKSNSGSSIPQPVMIIGEQGSGKTILLKRLYNSDICRGHHKIWIDGRTVFCSDDIISKSSDTGASMVFIDNMDFYLTRCSYEEQFKLRQILYNDGAPMLIGTVRKVLPALTDYEAPFFEGLKNVYIHPIPSHCISRLFDEQDAVRAHSLMSLLPPTIKSLETIYGIIKLNDIPEKDTSILLSIFSDKYRHSYQDLPTNSQHILNAFESFNTPITIPELRYKTGLPTNILTAYLKTLKLLGIIEVDKSIKRNTKYSLRDPLFQLWLQSSIQSLPYPI